jgi:hypothetical protein
MRKPLGRPYDRDAMAIANAVYFVMAVFLLLTPSLLAALAPTTLAGKPDGAVSKAPVGGRQTTPLRSLRS